MGMIKFKSIASTPLPESLVASIVLDKIVGRTPGELVALGYGKLSLRDISDLGWLCERKVTLRIKHENPH